MLNLTLDKLAHNASSQSELREARHAIPEFIKLESYPRVQQGGTLDIREMLRGTWDSTHREGRTETTRVGER